MLLHLTMTILTLVLAITCTCKKIYILMYILYINTYILHIYNMCNVDIISVHLTYLCIAGGAHLTPEARHLHLHHQQQPRPRPDQTRHHLLGPHYTDMCSLLVIN